MPTYTVTELLKMMEPQARRDKELITQCVSGLGLYAAQRAQEHPGSPKIEELRGLVDNLVCYWGLDFGDGAKPLDDFMQSFDSLVDKAKSGEEILPDSPNPNFAADTVYGLYRYGEDMVVGQGDVAKADILSASLPMREIGKAWDFNSYMLEDLASRLEAEATEMYQTTPLPGQPVSGENAGYEIKQAILFDDGRGYALAHNPAAASPYVTWMFRETNGERSYDLGHYLDSKAKARADYIYRVEDYMSSYKAAEKLPPELNEAEQNFAAWLAVIESSRYRWVEDEIYRLNGRGAMYYTGGEDGVYMRIQNDGQLEAGNYEDAFPHIGEATFKPVVTKQFDSFSKAYTAAMEAGGKRFMIDMFSGSEPQPLIKGSGRGKPDEPPSVMEEIKAARHAQSRPKTNDAPRLKKDKGAQDL